MEPNMDSSPSSITMEEKRDKQRAWKYAIASVIIGFIVFLFFMHNPLPDVLHGVFHCHTIDEVDRKARQCTFLQSFGSPFFFTSNELFVYFAFFPLVLLSVLFTVGGLIALAFMLQFVLAAAVNMYLNKYPQGNHKEAIMPILSFLLTVAFIVVGVYPFQKGPYAMKHTAAVAAQKRALHPAGIDTLEVVNHYEDGATSSSPYLLVSGTAAGYTYLEIDIQEKKEGQGVGMNIGGGETYGDAWRTELRLPDDATNTTLIVTLKDKGSDTNATIATSSIQMTPNMPGPPSGTVNSLSMKFGDSFRFTGTAQNLGSVYVELHDDRNQISWGERVEVINGAWKVRPAADFYPGDYVLVLKTAKDSIELARGVLMVSTDTPVLSQ